jgi:hypothetical protein
VSMNVTFQEEDPYYTKKVGLDQILEDFSPVNGRDHRKGDDDSGRYDCGRGSGEVSGASKGVVVGGMVPPEMDEGITMEILSNEERSSGILSIDGSSGDHDDPNIHI